MYLRLIVWAVLVRLAVPAMADEITFVPSDLRPGDTYHVAFVTDAVRDATSDEIGVYNDLVRGEAIRSNAMTEHWGIEWFAIASTPTVDASANIPVADSPLYLLNGPRIADNADDLWDGEIVTPITTDQFGTTKPNELVWTGTWIDGSRDLLYPLGASGGFSRVGVSYNAGDARFTLAFIEQTQNHPFYAVSEMLTVVPEPTGFGTCLVLSGLGGLVGLDRRRRTRPS